MATQSDHDKYFSRNIMMIHQLARDGSMSVQELAQEYSVDKRTIYRDLKRLHFFPIELENGQVSIAEGFSIGNSNLHDNELLIAELALSAIDDIDDNTNKQIQTIRSKMMSPMFFTPYDIKAQSYQELNMDSELLNKIEDAIKKCNIAKITSHEQTLVVEPYKIVAFDGFWYLLAKDTTDNKIKTYMISQIKEFRASTQVYKTDFKNIDEVLDNVHTAWFEDGSSFEVKIRVKSEIAHYFKLKKHLSSQEILKENSDGSLLVKFEVSCDEDVDNLIKGWLPHIEVIQPERFRKKIILELEEYVKELKSAKYDFNS